MVRTAVIYDEGQGDLKFFVYDGDLRDLDNVYINQYGGDEVKMTRLYDTLYDENGYCKVEFCDREQFTDAIQRGAYVTVCGFLP